MIAIISPATLVAATSVAEKVANATNEGAGNGSSGDGGLLGLLRSLGQGVEGLAGVLSFLLRHADFIAVLALIGILVALTNVIGDNIREQRRIDEQHRHETAELLKALGDKATPETIQAANRAVVEPQGPSSLPGLILSIPRALLSHLPRKK